MHRDDAGVLALEAVLAACLIAGTAMIVLAVPPPPAADAASWRFAQQDAEDALLALEAQRVDGVSLLESDVGAALACASLAPPAACDAPAYAARIGAYLPPGTSYRLLLSNGGAQRVLHGAQGEPLLEAATASVLLAPRWEHALVLSELSCQDPTAPAQVRIVPMRNGVVASPRAVQVDVAGLALPARPLGGGAWNASLPASAWVVDRSASVEAQARGATLAGEVELASCLLGASGRALQNATRNASLSSRSAAPGGVVSWSYDLRPLLAAAPSASLRSVTLEVHSPSQPAPGELPPLEATLPLGSASVGSARWGVPQGALLGVHPSILRVELVVPTAAGPVEVEARLLALPLVTHPDGSAPLDPLYRVSLQLWREGP